MGMPGWVEEGVWWCSGGGGGGVGVEEGEIGGGRWCRVSVGWQSAREAAGFGRRLAAAATGRRDRAAGQQGRRGRSKPAASKAVCQGGERQQVAVSERQTPANCCLNPLQCNLNVDGESEGLSCVCPMICLLLSE